MARFKPNDADSPASEEFWINLNYAVAF